MQTYSDPARENDPQALPDVEIFWHQHAKRELCALNAGHKAALYGECVCDNEGDCRGTGWYWWPRFPGCLPDGEANGPFDTEDKAKADALQGLVCGMRTFAS